MNIFRAIIYVMFVLGILLMELNNISIVMKLASVRLELN